MLQILMQTLKFSELYSAYPLNIEDTMIQSVVYLLAPLMHLTRKTRASKFLYYEIVSLMNVNHVISRMQVTT